MSRDDAPLDLRARVLAEVARTPSPNRASYTRRRRVLAGVFTVATAALFVAMGGMNHGPRSDEAIAFMAGFALLAAVVTTHVSSGVGATMLGRPRGTLLVAVLVTAPVLAAAAALAPVAWPATSGEHLGAGAHVLCGLVCVAQGALPLVALLLAKRGTDPLHPALTGAALGMAAGTWAVLMASLRCPHADAIHGIVAHAAPTLVLAAAGAALGALLLRVK